MNDSKSFSKAVICSPDIYPESVKALQSFGIGVLFSCKNQNVMPPLMYHADMQIVKTGSDSFICAPECYDYYSCLLTDYNAYLTCGNTYLSCNYPGDIAYNIIITQTHAIHNFKYTDSVLKGDILGKNLINVSQGYTACTLCALSDTAFVTSDMGLYNTLTQNMLDVLLIDDSSILLPGFDHGFFGGATLMLSSDTLAVNGNISKHPDYDKIKSFCLNYGIGLVSLSDKAIMDIGSFIKVNPW